MRIFPDISSGARAPHANTSAVALEGAISARFGGRAPIFEFELPTAPDDRRAPKGVVLLVHGGGWVAVGQHKVDTMDPTARRWQDRGWLTVNVDYAPGRRSVADVRAFYDAVRAWQGLGVPIGLQGSSAGGHLALMTAISRPDAAFVVGMGAVTDPSRIAVGGSAKQQANADRSFGAEAGTTFSIVARAGELRSDLDVVLATSTADRTVSPQQPEWLRDARPSTRVLQLEAGAVAFTHAGVSPAGFARFVAVEDALAARHALRTAAA